ncbi:uncharacterized protein LOC116197883 [Punica granatum]|uniref:Avr9/Cf-9 rapidly elicited protein 146 n=2 Tax=Punica granatum TaxID=22663 RepID=A0A218XIG8_PUNGR|nr:uncharacterized protein LOC116197883 [Punica granatum]OWM84516.1 hypothetical protein CDL15_Pgr000956 [Punica granatum]PKI38221.1 hypothetical protein CRG98_041391 [Punica granatum]
MEIERSTADQVAKKAWSLLKAVFFMLRKGLLKGKFVVDLHVLLKRGKLAGKAFGNLMVHHYSAVSCRSDDAHLSFVSPREYEFSCSNSPADYTYFHYSRNRHGLGLGYNHRRSSARLPKPNVATLAAVQRVLEMLNNEAAAAVEGSPAVALPGFGKSPMGRQLRITDSPFPLKDDGDSHQVNVAAEEFIKNFYKDLRLQKVNMANLDSPYHYGTWS